MGPIPTEEQGPMKPLYIVNRLLYKAANDQEKIDEVERVASLIIEVENEYERERLEAKQEEKLRTVKEAIRQKREFFKHD